MEKVDIFRKHLSEQIRAEREAMGLTRKEAADKVYITYPAYAHFEREPPVNLNVLVDYIEKLGLCPVEMFQSALDKMK